MAILAKSLGRLFGRSLVGDSIYDDQRAMLRQRDHRAAIGGLWDEVGQLQLDFLVEQGLEPQHVFLDVGCGSLRAGVKLIPYLDPGNYWGMDINSSLLDAGWEKEILPRGLETRQPSNQIIALKDFEFDQLSARFDYAIATSVFTHLSFNRIRRCLTKLAPQMSEGGKFFATFFEGGADLEEPLRHSPGDVVTHSHMDPFHYSRSDAEIMAAGLWDVDWIGGWNHPRDQQMVLFTKR